MRIHLSIRILRRVEAGPRRAAVAWSRCLPCGEADAVGDVAQVLVGEPVPVTAQLPGQHPLAERLPPRSGVLIDDACSMQQRRLRLGAAVMI